LSSKYLLIVQNIVSFVRRYKLINFKHILDQIITMQNFHLTPQLYHLCFASLPWCTIQGISGLPLLKRRDKTCRSRLQDCLHPIYIFVDYLHII